MGKEPVLTAPETLCEDNFKDEEFKNNDLEIWK